MNSNITDTRYDTKSYKLRNGVEIDDEIASINNMSNIIETNIK